MIEILTGAMYNRYKNLNVNATLKSRFMENKTLTSAVVNDLNDSNGMKGSIYVLDGGGRGGEEACSLGTCASATQRTARSWQNKATESMARDAPGYSHGLLPLSGAAGQNRVVNEPLISRRRY